MRVVLRATLFWVESRNIVTLMKELLLYLLLPEVGDFCPAINNWVEEYLHHSRRFLNHKILFLPMLPLTTIFPRITSWSSWYRLLLQMWCRNSSLLSLTILLEDSSFEILSFQDILKIVRYNHKSKDSSYETAH